MLLKSKVAIVTGGTRGIGRAIVFDLIQNGAKVLFTYLKSDESAGIILDEIKGLKGEAEAIKADVRLYDEAKKAVEETVNRFGKVDILVNNAGITKDKALMMMEPSEWLDVINTDLTGYFNMAKACIVTMMKQKSGVIVNISSIAGVVGMPRQVNYSSAKAGELGLTKSLAKEVASYGIRVNAVAPGFIDTDMTKELKQKDEFLKMIPFGRFGKPEEVAKVIKKLVAEIVEVEIDKITPEASFVEDLGMDSMMVLEILASIEKKYKLRIPEENLTKITNLSKVVELVDEFLVK
ncbi:MAG: 3-oxoacyl-ACP reductase FabG [Candidatus Omnitrophica bacterium]|nr:3-oxoacyl-ACP reductase FabG [Candidatus Omnitrophota bacterium]